VSTLNLKEKALTTYSKADLDMVLEVCEEIKDQSEEIANAVDNV